MLTYANRDVYEGSWEFDMMDLRLGARGTISEVEGVSETVV